MQPQVKDWHIKIGDVAIVSTTGELTMRDDGTVRISHYDTRYGFVGSTEVWPNVGSDVKILVEEQHYGV